ncbi:MAG: hypothetical protein LBC87_02070 [Fibromonadaceae bacterium]|jgi:hypothetical protein|nr:hypothetical protein [Fibromonadaceae bacterium]
MITSISIGAKPFKTKADACNTVFGCNYKKELQRGCFIPAELRKNCGDKYHAWFPHLDTVVDPGWINKLNTNGTVITETLRNTAEVQKVYNKGKNWTYVTFAKTDIGYEFMGVFKMVSMAGNTITFERKFTKFPYP